MEPICILEEYLNSSQESLRRRTYYIVYRALQFPNITNATFTPDELLKYAKKIDADELLRRLRGLPLKLWKTYNDCVNECNGNKTPYETERRAIELLESRLR
jgi:hypothetical protein